MRFPLIFTDFDKQRALDLRRLHPELGDEEIITRIVAEIRAETERGDNVPLTLSLTKRLAQRKKSHAKKVKPRRTVLRRLPGSFESAHR